MYLNLAAFVLVMALSLTPLFARWGRWLWVSIAAFVLAEAGLIAWVERDLSQPDTDGPAVMLVGLVFLVPGALFAVSLVGRLIWRTASYLLKVRRELVHQKQVISQAERSTPHAPHA